MENKVDIDELELTPLMGVIEKVNYSENKIEIDKLKLAKLMEVARRINYSENLVVQDYSAKLIKNVVIKFLINEYKLTNEEIEVLIEAGTIPKCYNNCTECFNEAEILTAYSYFEKLERIRLKYTNAISNMLLRTPLEKRTCCFIECMKYLYDKYKSPIGDLFKTFNDFCKSYPSEFLQDNYTVLHEFITRENPDLMRKVKEELDVIQ